MGTKTVWEKDIDCDGVTYRTSITKPIYPYGKQWQIALHVKVDGKTFHDYNTHFLIGAGAWDGEVLREQVMCMYGRLLKNLPDNSAEHKTWYRKMTMEYFVSETFDFEL